MRIPLIAAPTASGKTALALLLARHLPLEVISADAMMVYRDMNIGTAKPSAKELASAPHHLIDVVTPSESFNVADYVRLAEAAITDVLARGKLPLVVGGTGFYMRALAGGVPTTPAADLAAQQPLWERLEQEGVESLHNELAAFSPADAERAQRNPRRVVRALEIIARTGRAPSSFTNTTPVFNYRQLIFLPELAVLRPRIAARVAQMFEAGLVNEVKALVAEYPDFVHTTARQAIGYKEVLELLNGHATLDEAKAAVTLATSQYAKRQRTWFRKEAARRPETTRVYEGLAEAFSAEALDWLQEA